MRQISDEVKDEILAISNLHMVSLSMVSVCVSNKQTQLWKAVLNELNSWSKPRLWSPVRQITNIVTCNMTPHLRIVLKCLSPWSTASEVSKMILIASSQITQHIFLLCYLFIRNKIILANKLILLSQSWCCLYSAERSEKIAIWFMQNLAEEDWVVLTQFCAYFCIHIVICLHVLTGCWLVLLTQDLYH